MQLILTVNSLVIVASFVLYASSTAQWRSVSEVAGKHWKSSLIAVIRVDVSSAMYLWMNCLNISLFWIHTSLLTALSDFTCLLVFYLVSFLTSYWVFLCGVFCDLVQWWLVSLLCHVLLFSDISVFLFIWSWWTAGMG